jgi:elongation factor 1-alpha
MLDSLAEERERGLTIESSLQQFESDSFSFMAVDTPGHMDYDKNMLSVTSLADVAVLVVSAAAGEWEAGHDSGRVRELALCCFTMGIKNVVVVVTKMDDLSVSFASARFEDIKKAVEKFLKDVGYKQKDIPFIPATGLSGVNLLTKAAETGWYGGPTLLEALNSMGPINRPAEKPLRLPVLKVHSTDNGTVVVGRVETGSLRTGIKVIFSPSGHIAEVQSIQIAGKEVSEAKGGDIVGFCIGDELGAGDIRRGMVASYSTNDPAADCEAMVAQVVVLEHPGSIRAGYCPSIAVHTAQVACEFEELLSKIDRKTGKDAETNPECAKTGDVVTVRMRPINKVCIELFSAYPSLGRFTVRDHGRTVAVGVVKEVTKRPIPKVRTGNENTYFEE